MTDKKIIRIRHLKEFSRYNHNIYKVYGFKKFNIVSEEAEDSDTMCIYRKGIFRFDEMRWLDEYFEAEDIEFMTKEEWENLKIKQEFT